MNYDTNALNSNLTVKIQKHEKATIRRETKIHAGPQCGKSQKVRQGPEQPFNQLEKTYTVTTDCSRTVLQRLEKKERNAGKRTASPQEAKSDDAPKNTRALNYSEAN